MADLAVWQRTIVDEEGNVIPGAEVEVRREEDGSLATLYADREGETPLANPLTADMSGFVRFFAQGDAYNITAVGAGSTRTWRFDPTGRLQEFDRVSDALAVDDGADTAETRSLLGTFSTVADVENSHIPPVLDSIRTNGYYTPGDGGGALYKRVTSEPSHNSKVQSADGSWWVPVVPPGYAFDSVSDMQASRLVAPGARVRTLGYYTPGDGGGNDYEIVAAGTGTDDGGSFINLSGSGNQARSLGKLYPKHFGAVGDGVTNDEPSFRKWMEYCNTNNIFDRDIGPGYFLIDSQATPLPIETSCHIHGAGREATRVIYKTNSAVPLWSTLSVTSASNMLDSVTFSDFAIHGDHDTNRTNIGAPPLHMHFVKNLDIRNMEVKYSRTMGIIARQCDFASATGNLVQYCARDGINFASCNEVIIANNWINSVDDDAIAVHNQRMRDTRAIVITGNKINKSQGIKVLGAKIANISNNVLLHFFNCGITINTDSIGDNEGVNASVDVVITGNVLSDPLSRAGLDGANTRSAYLSLSGASYNKGTATFQPGLTSPPYDYYHNISSFSDDHLDTPIPTSGRYVISNNVFTRSLPETGMYSDTGNGLFWLRDGEYDFDLSNSSHTVRSVMFLGEGYLENIIFTGNSIFGARDLFTYQTAATRFRDFKVTDCTFKDMKYIISCLPGVDEAIDIEFKNCMFDLDPFFRNENRNPDGSYVQFGGPTAFLLQGCSGVRLIECGFKNVCRVVDGNNDNAVRNGIITYERCTVYADPADIGFSTSNKGVGFIIGGSYLVKVDCDRSSPDFGRVTSIPAYSAHQIPTTGTYLEGNFVRRNWSNVYGSPPNRNVLTGWWRATTGDSHEPGVDWFEARVPIE